MARLLLLPLLLLPCLAPAMARVQGDCSRGAQPVLTANIPSTTQVMRSYPACTVTVYVSGTYSLAALSSTSTGTALSNPFTADKFGHWFFYVPDGPYDVQFSGAGISTPFTYGSVSVIDSQANWGTSGTAISKNTALTDRNIDITAFGCKGDRLISGINCSLTGSILASSNALTINGYTVTTSDIGKFIQISGAGASGVALNTAITGTASGLALLSASATTTVSNSPIDFGTDNSTCLDAVRTYGNASGLRNAFIPVGNFATCRTWALPSLWTVQGTGFGDSFTQSNSLLSACPTFQTSTPTIDPITNISLTSSVSLTTSDFVMQIGGNSGGIGGGYRNHLWNFTIDTSGLTSVSGALYANAQEESDAQNFSVLNLGPSAAGIYLYQGQSMGFFTGIEILTKIPDANTTGFVANGITGMDRGVNGVTINMNNSSGITPPGGTRPTRAMWASGNQINVFNTHMEGVGEGITLGNPTTTASQYSENNVQGGSFIGNTCGPNCNITYHVLNSGLATNSYNYHFIDSTMGSVATIQDDNFSSVTSDSPFYLIGGAPQDAGGKANYTRFSLATGDPNYWTFPIFNSMNYVQTGQNGIIGVDYFAVCSYCGMNMQGYLDGTATNNSRGFVGQNLTWDHATQLYHYYSNGGGDFAGWNYANGGNICAENATGLSQPGTLTTVALQAYAHFCVTPSGHAIVAPTLDPTAGTVSNDTGQAFQVKGVADATGGFSSNGTAGVTTTVTVGSCSLTYTGGILTAHSGC